MHVLDPIGFVEPCYGEEEILLFRCMAVAKETGRDPRRNHSGLVRRLRKCPAQPRLREAADRNHVLRPAQPARVEPPVHVDLGLLQPLLGAPARFLRKAPQDVPAEEFAHSQAAPDPKAVEIIAESGDEYIALAKRQRRVEEE